MLILLLEGIQERSIKLQSLSYGLCCGKDFFPQLDVKKNVFAAVCVCLRGSECQVCVFMRERERDRVCVCVWMCNRERTRVCVCVLFVCGVVQCPHSLQLFGENAKTALI